MTERTQDDHSHSDAAAGGLWGRALIALVVVALVIRVGFLLLRTDILETEGQVYIRIAENLASGRGMLGIREQGLQLFYPPLYPWLISIGIRAGLGPALSAHAIALVTGAALVLPVAFVGRAAFNATAGLLAGLLVAVHPALVVTSASTMAEPVYFLLLASATSLVIVDRTPARIAAAGVLAGLAYLVRSEAIVLLVFAPLFLWFAAHEARPARLRFVLAFTASLGVVVAAYTAYLWSETGKPRLEAKSPENLLIGTQIANGVRGPYTAWGVDTSLRADGVFMRSNLDVIRQADTTERNTLHFVRTIGVHNVVRGGIGLVRSESLGQPFIGLLAVLGLFSVALTRKTLIALSVPIALSVASVAALASLHLFYVRYLLGVLPWLIVCAAAGLVRLHLTVRDTALELGISKSRARPVAYLASAAAVGLLCLASANAMREMPEFAEAWSPARADLRAAGERLRGPLGAVRIVDTDVTVAYYSGAVFRPWPYSDTATARRFLDADPPDYIVLRGRPSSWPYLQEWYELGPPADRAQLEFVVGDAKVYRWRK